VTQPAPRGSPRELNRLDAGQARASLGDWLGPYTRCFSAPPWNEPVHSLADYQAKVGWHFQQPGFRALEVRTDGGSVIAVAYGWPSPETLPEYPYYQSLADCLGPDRMRQIWSARPFEVVELMVDPVARRQGLGRQLLAHLCPSDGVSWLATRSDSPAAAVYRRLGWRHVGDGVGNTSATPLGYFVLDPRQRLIGST